MVDRVQDALADRIDDGGLREVCVVVEYEGRTDVVTAAAQVIFFPVNIRV